MTVQFAKMHGLGNDFMVLDMISQPSQRSLAVAKHDMQQRQQEVHIRARANEVVCAGDRG